MEKKREFEQKSARKERGKTTDGCKSGFAKYGGHAGLR